MAKRCLNSVAGRFLPALLALLPAAAHLADAPALPAQALSGGAFTADDSGPGAYSHPSPLLTAEQGELFALGHRMFHNKWAFYWFESAEWGRGPTSNAQSCASCHSGNGRGLAPGDADSLARGSTETEPPRDSHIAVRTEPAMQLVARIKFAGRGCNRRAQSASALWRSAAERRRARRCACRGERGRRVGGNQHGPGRRRKRAAALPKIASGETSLSARLGTTSPSP